MDILELFTNNKNVEFPRKEKIISLTIFLLISFILIVGLTGVSNAETTYDTELRDAKSNINPASETCKKLNTDISGFVDLPLQPVQSVWVDDPKWDQDQIVGSWGDMRVFPGNNPNLIHNYGVLVPMVEGKKTKLFLFHKNSFKHRRVTELKGSISNGYLQQKRVKLKISSEDPEFEYVTNETFIVPAAEPDPDDECNNQGSIDISSFKISKKGIPEEPFELKQEKIIIKIEIVNPKGNPIKDSIPQNNQLKYGLEIFPVKTLKMDIFYVPVKLQNTTRPSQNKVDRLARHSTEFIKGAFPVDEDKVQRNISSKAEVFDRLHNTVFSNTKEGLANYLGNLLQKLSEIGTLNDYDKVVGVTRKDSFGDWWGNYTNFSDTTQGISHPNIHGAVLTTAENPTAPVHEIGHTYGLYTGNTQEEYSLASPGHEANGFWVQKEKNMDGKVSFMGTFVSPNNPYSKDHWIDKPDYRQLLQKFQNLDPTILYITGTVSKDGDSNFDEIYKLKGGIDKTLNHTRGNYSIIFKNNSGIINSTTFNVSFGIDAGLTNIDLESDTAPFSFRVPYVDGTEKIQLENKKGQIVAEKIISSNTPKIKNIDLNQDSVSWQATDQDDNSLTYNVFIGNNGKFKLLKYNTQKDSLSINSNLISKYSQLKIVANDGVNTAQKTINIDNRIKKDENEDNENKSIIDKYDINSNNQIERSELRQAIIDFVRQKITRSELRQIIVKYIQKQVGA